MTGMPVAHGAKDPGAVQFIAIMLRVESSIRDRIPFVNGRVLGVAMPDRSFQGAQGGAGIDALPEEMRWIEVGADGSTGGSAELEECLRVVDNEAGMHFQADLLDALAAGPIGGLRPVRDHDPVPLVLENLQVVGRPRAGDPVWAAVTGCAAWASTKGDDGVDLQLSGEAHDFSIIRIEGGRLCSLGVQWIPGGIESGDL